MTPGIFGWAPGFEPEWYTAACAETVKVFARAGHMTPSARRERARKRVKAFDRLGRERARQLAEVGQLVKDTKARAASGSGK